jgi:hypothetical protein
MKLVEYRVPLVRIGLTRAHLVVAMLSLNVSGIYGSLIFKIGVYSSFTQNKIIEYLAIVKVEISVSLKT